MAWSINDFPPLENVETRSVLKALPKAHRSLAELKGVVQTIPNQQILLHTLPLQEARDSSAVENIITTNDDLFRAMIQSSNRVSPEVKEVQNYSQALSTGFRRLREKDLLMTNDILVIQSELEKNNAGLRKLPGTTLKNSETGEIIYTPPQDTEEIISLLADLETFINDDLRFDFDPLVKMALIHFQFESIHPFYDGNGRTGRIINILYLVLKRLLDLPILYLSRYIIQNKDTYYHLLQNIRDNQSWEEWILFILRGIDETSSHAIQLVLGIRELMTETKHQIRSDYKFYSQDLMNSLFKHPYTRIEFLVQDLDVSRVTAANYLNQLAVDGLLKKEKLGASNYYVNDRLFALFQR